MWQLPFHSESQNQYATWLYRHIICTEIHVIFGKIFTLDLGRLNLLEIYSRYPECTAQFAGNNCNNLIHCSPYQAMQRPDELLHSNSQNYKQRVTCSDLLVVR